MPHKTTTATKDEWAAFSACPAGHSIGGVVTVEPNSPVPMPAPSIVAPPAFPGLSLAIPADVSRQIDALTRTALDGAGLADLPAFEELATETTFGPDVGRLTKAGLSRPLAASVARWGSAVYHFGTRLVDARSAAQWASDATVRAVERRGEVDAANLVYVRKVAGQWGGAGTHVCWRNDIATRPDIAPPERDAKAANARLVAYQVEGRLRHLLSTGGLPCRMAVGLAATFDGPGWSETACMIAGEMTGAQKHRLAKREAEKWIASVAHDAVRWAELTWRTAERPGPVALLRA